MTPGSGKHTPVERCFFCFFNFNCRVHDQKNLEGTFKPRLQWLVLPAFYEDPITRDDGVDQRIQRQWSGIHHVLWL